MKYENYDEVKKIVEKIAGLQYRISDLNGLQLHIIIQDDGHKKSLLTIGVDKRFEHPYQKYAAELVNVIKYELQKDIDALKKQLEPL